MIHGHYQLELKLKEGGETMHNWRVIFWMPIEVQAETEAEAIKRGKEDLTEELQRTGEKVDLMDLFQARAELVDKG